jgi:hypothetical protein
MMLVGYVAMGVAYLLHRRQQKRGPGSLGRLFRLWCEVREVELRQRLEAAKPKGGGS